jgi:arylsulfatase A-like enzyme
MKKLFFFLVILFGCETKNDSLPNVILVLVDDLGYNDVGFNGSNDIRTPNIDMLSQNGVTFTNGYVSYPVCSPSRAGIITGRYQDKFGYGLNILYTPKDPKMGLPLSEYTLADLFKSKNYITSAIGKWHLGAHESLRPLNRGFDEFFGFLTGGHRYFPEEWTLEDETEVKSQGDAYRTKLLRNDQRVEENEYLTDALSREAINFIDRNNDNPFFLYLAYNAPHGPLQATKKYLDRYDHIDDKRRKTYAAMVSSVDDGVGDVIDKLKQHNILDNTIIYFLSDNGGSKFNSSNNSPLKGFKGELYEGGLKVPFVMHWPAKIKPNTVFEKPVISLDIFATIKSVINPSLELKNPLHGKNLMPYISGKNNEAPHDYLFWRNNGHQPPQEDGTRPRYITWALRTLDYKLLIRRNDSMLFDLENDISESINIKDSLSESFNFLNSKIKEWNESNLDPVFLGLKDNKLYNKLNPDRFK